MLAAENVDDGSAVNIFEILQHTESYWTIMKYTMLMTYLSDTFLHTIRGLFIRLLFPSPILPKSPLVLTEKRLFEVDKHKVGAMCLRAISIMGMRPYPLDELMLMVGAFAYHRPKLVIDVGTHVGKSARIWWELAQSWGISSAVYTIDLMSREHPEYPGTDLGRFIRGTGVIQCIGDSYPVAAKLIADHPSVPTLVFLDGSHEYDIVRRDLELIHRLDDGCVLVHDTMFQPGSDYNHGPYEAVRDFLQSYPAYQVIQTNIGLPGLTYIAVKRKEGNTD